MSYLRIDGKVVKIIMVALATTLLYFHSQRLTSNRSLEKVSCHFQMTDLGLKALVLCLNTIIL